uniref:Uncharacterized protein n=1 Tax=Alexandrium monilatum TaxID=311494 RepID=A0A7S4UBX7_9DINO
MAPPLDMDPDDAVDLLPHPFRLVAQALDEAFGDMWKEIHEIEKRRRSEEYEFGLPQVDANGFHQITGRVTCVGVDPRGSNRFAVGTDQGQVLLVDGAGHRAVAAGTPCGPREKIHCLAVSSATTFRQHGRPDAAEARRRPSPKLAVAGAARPRILVYDIRRECLGPSLRPLCSVDLRVPAEEADTEGAPSEEAKPPVAQLCCCGSRGALWLAVLLSSGSCVVYLCPPGPSDDRGEASQTSLVRNTIPEEEELRADAGGEADEFSNVDVIAVPLYRFELPSMAPIAELPEPPLSGLLASAFCLAPERRAPPPTPLPLTLLLASTGSSVVFGYSLQLPEPAGPRSEDPDELLREKAPDLAPGALAQPEKTLPAAARRRWVLPARTTVRAVSADGSVFSVGGSDGSVALFWTAPAPALKTMLAGHYAAVSGMAFSGFNTLITAGRDSRVHMYSVARQTVTLRCLLTPPPTTPPGIDVVTAPTVPIGLILDEKGKLRLMDTRLCRKLAAAVYHDEKEVAREKARKEAELKAKREAAKKAREAAKTGHEGPEEAGKAEAADPAGEAGAASDAGPAKEEGHADDAGQAGVANSAKPAEPQVQRQVLALTSGFCVLCCHPEPPPPAEAPRPAEDAQPEGAVSAGSDGAAAAPGVGEDEGQEAAATAEPLATAPLSTELYFFDHAHFLPRLFEGIASRMGGGAKAGQLFQSLSAVELNMPPDDLAMTSKASTTTSAPLTAANIERAQVGRTLQGQAEETHRVGEAAAARRLVPEGWQANVKKYLRGEINEKAARQVRMQKRMEQIRMELEQRVS